MKYISWETRDYINSIWGLEINDQYIILDENTNKIIRWSQMFDASEWGHWKTEEIDKEEASRKMGILIKEVFREG
ncbi:MAG: hypothetical protein ACFFC1_20435 [Promethearchaeota archaeon]